MKYRILFALFMVLGATVAHAATPSSWPRQVGGKGTAAYMDTNPCGFVVLWYNPPLITGQPWTRTYFYGNWNEVSGGAVEAIKQMGILMSGTTEATLAMLWTNNVKPRTTQDYSCITPMVNALVAKWDAVNLPSPRPPMTVAPAVYNIVKQQNKVVMVVVGSIAVPSPCKADQQVNGLYVVDRSAVTWTGSVRPAVVYAACEFRSP
jgi:hypothetical protein